MSELRARLAAVPAVTLPPSAPVLVDDVVHWLGSPEALALIAEDPYWPKWDGPWWQMTTLWELGHAERIPKRTARAMVDALNAMPLHTFPLREEDWPPGADRHRHASCHCAIGTMAQVLAACGVDIERELPWFASWFTRYQMADGGYNCDDTAYLVPDETPSSMVATVPVLEALIDAGPSDACDRAIAMLLGRELRHGSPTRHNAEERSAAEQWPLITFPRFYFYDVLRGLVAVVRWAVQHGQTLPLAAISPVIEQLLASAPDGVIRVGRAAWAGKQGFSPANGWTARMPTTVPPLVAAISVLGEPVPTLTAQWAQTRADLIALVDAGRIT